MPKGKSKWSDIIQKQHPYLRKGNTDSTAFCTKCICHFSIASGGNCDVERHIKTEKHLRNERAAACSSITRHFLMVETLRALLFVKCNFKHTCIEFYKYLLSAPNLLRQIVSKSKYKPETDENGNSISIDTSFEE